MLKNLSVPLLILSISILLFLGSYRMYKMRNEVKRTVETDTVYVNRPIIRDTVYIKGKTTIIKVTKIDTLYNTIITYDDIVSEVSSLYNDDMYSDSLFIRYSSVRDTFMINRNIKIKDRVVSHIVTIEKEKSPELYKFTGNIGIWNSSKESPLSIGIGVKILEKYSITANVKTDKQCGIQIGIDF